MQYTSDYLALIIDYFLGENERNDFILKLSHEFKSPAVSIFNHAESLISHYENDIGKFNHRFELYMNDILILSKMQYWQADTNFFISKVRTNLPCSEKYDHMGIYLLEDIIRQGKKTVITIARAEKVSFDRINIDIPDWKLWIDWDAFVMIFYNMLITSIKYRTPASKDFLVEVTENEDRDWLIVRDPRQSRGLEFVNRSKRLSRLKATESIAYLKVFSVIPAACPQLPFFTYISPDCLRTLILPLAFVGCTYSSFSLSFGIHTEVFYIVVNVKHWESPGKAGGLPFKSG